MQKRKIKIIHIITGIAVGGAENHLLSLLGKLDRRKYKIDLAYLKDKAELKDAFESIGISPIRIDLKSNYDLIALWRLFRLIKRERYNIVHTHLFHADTYGTLAAYLAKVPIIISSKHNDEEFLQKLVYKMLHRVTTLFSKKIIALSDHVKDYVVRIGVGNPDKVKTIYYGLDWRPYDNLNRSYTVREEFGIDKRTILIGTIARLTKQKGLKYLLEAFRQVLDTEKNCKLMIVGRGELEDELKNLSKELGIEDKVIFTGFREDIPEIMHSLDIFVLPSLWEGLGRVFLEAMAARKPIVATNVSAIPEVIANGETGILVPPRNPGALVKGILHLIKNPDAVIRMGEAGRKRLEEKFSIEEMVRKTKEIYESLIKDEAIQIHL